jgi:hypothetical protein
MASAYDWVTRVLSMVKRAHILHSLTVPSLHLLELKVVLKYYVAAEDILIVFDQVKTLKE